MGLQGSIQPDHLSQAKFTFNIIGLPPLHPITVSGLGDEIDTVELPDQTMASGGGIKPTELTITFPGHGGNHAIEVEAMEIWYKECKGNVSPNYKKAGTLTVHSISGSHSRSYGITGVFVTKRSISDLDMNNDGDMHTHEYGLSIDAVEALPFV